jgi:hypothetical protein
VILILGLYLNREQWTHKEFYLSHENFIRNEFLRSLMIVMEGTAELREHRIEISAVNPFTEIGSQLASFFSLFLCIKILKKFFLLPFFAFINKINFSLPTIQANEQENNTKRVKMNNELLLILALDNFLFSLSFFSYSLNNFFVLHRPNKVFFFGYTL